MMTKFSLWAAVSILTILFVCSLLPIRFNTSQSLPHLFYWITKEPPARGDIVSFCMPKTVFSAPSMRGDCGNGTMALVKYLIGVPGDQARISDGKIIINGNEFDAPQFDTTSNGHPLPRPSKTEFILGNDEYLVYTPAARSFDSRYYGHINSDQIIGKAHGW